MIKTIILLISAFTLMTCESQPKPKSVQNESVNNHNAGYVGGVQCIECHRHEYDLWMGSDHQLAMQEVSDKTVLGDFNNVVFNRFGVKSRFYKKDTLFYVYTEGPEGKYYDYPIKYVFGVRPLQQYLVEFPGGRLQTLPLCWDARPKEQGGQRWFHIYGKEEITADDPLYWTKVVQNWNYMCAECHSTNLRKNYDVQADSFNTVWSEINVSCEACHGPASRHITWAEAHKEGQAPDWENAGFPIQMKEAGKNAWQFDMESGTAKRTAPVSSPMLVETCARCHARRGALTDDYKFNQPLAQTHIPSDLIEPLYFHDGQIRDEVYVYQSFRQSKMYQNGVICTDCHEPHSAKVYVQGNALCFRCHLHEKYGPPSHHFHKEESKGALCVECHMPERTYMEVDPRRDHSIRIPRPDLSVKLEVPNACNRCHPDKSNEWSVDYVRKWYGPGVESKPHYGEIFAKADAGNPEIRSDLFALAGNAELDGIVRAGAIIRLREFLQADILPIITKLLADKDPLVRKSALVIIDYFPAEQKLDIVKSLLSDPIRLVRIEAARALLNVNQDMMSNYEQSEFLSALQEYIDAQLFNGEHYISQLNLGAVYNQLGQTSRSESHYKRAISQEPKLPNGYINLTDLYRAQKRDQMGYDVLLQGIEQNPESAALYYSLALLLVREKKTGEAIEKLQKAVALNPEDLNYAYALGLALNGQGKFKAAVKIMTKALKNRPYDQQILFALTTIFRDHGDIENSSKHAAELVKYWPENRQYRQLLIQLQNSAPK